MKIHAASKTILVENPGTGNVSVSAALGMSPVEGVPPFALPAEGRHAMGEEAWRDHRKVVLVRDPVQRFNSMATRLMFEAVTGVLDPCAVEELALSLQDAKPAKRAEALLEFVALGEDVPVAFLPQKRWLSCKFDTVLATRDIAEHFNKEVGKCCQRINQFHGNPLMRPVRVTAPEALVREVYAEDYALFETLRVWSPSPTKVRLVSGVCVPCSAKLADKRKDEEELEEGKGLARAVAVSWPEGGSPDDSDDAPSVEDVIAMSGDDLGDEDLHERAKTEDAEDEGTLPKRKVRKRGRSGGD